MSIAPTKAWPSLEESMAIGTNHNSSNRSTTTIGTNVGVNVANSANITSSNSTTTHQQRQQQQHATQTRAAMSDGGVAPEQRAQAALDAPLDATWCVWDASGRSVARRDDEPADCASASAVPPPTPSVGANGSAAAASSAAMAVSSTLGGVVLRATVGTLRQLWTAIGGAVGDGVRSLAVFRLGVRPSPDDPFNVRGGVWSVSRVDADAWQRLVLALLYARHVTLRTHVAGIVLLFDATPSCTAYHRSECRVALWTSQAAVPHDIVAHITAILGASLPTGAPVFWPHPRLASSALVATSNASLNNTTSANLTSTITSTSAIPTTSATITSTSVSNSPSAPVNVSSTGLTTALISIATKSDASMSATSSGSASPWPHSPFQSPLMPSLDLTQPSSLFDMPSFELGGDPPLLSYLTAPLPVRVQSDSFAASRPRSLRHTDDSSASGSGGSGAGGGSSSGGGSGGGGGGIVGAPHPSRSISDPVELFLPTTDDESMNFAMFELAAMRLLDDPLDAPYRAPPGLAPIGERRHQQQPQHQQQQQQQQHSPLAHNTSAPHPLRQHSGPQQLAAAAVAHAQQLQLHLLNQQQQHLQQQQQQQYPHQAAHQHQFQELQRQLSASPPQGDDDDECDDDDDDAASGSPVKTKRRRPGKRQRERRKAARAAAAAAAAAAQTGGDGSSSSAATTTTSIIATTTTTTLQQQTLSSTTTGHFSSMLGQPFDAPLLQRTSRPEFLSLSDLDLR